MSTGRKPAYSFTKQLDDTGTRFLSVAVWPAKSGKGDVISVRVRKNEGGQWGDIERLTLYCDYVSGEYWELKPRGVAEVPSPEIVRKSPPERARGGDEPFDAPDPEDW